jgi:ABC-type tungstate transport system substrate-binding protein
MGFRMDLRFEEVTESIALIRCADAELLQALRMDGAGDHMAGRELVRATLPQILLAIIAAFGRAIAEVGAPLMVGGNRTNPCPDDSNCA